MAGYKQQIISVIKAYMTGAGLTKLEVSDEQIWQIVFPWVHSLFNQYVPYLVYERLDLRTLPTERRPEPRKILLNAERPVLGIIDIAPNIGSYLPYTRNIPFLGNFDYNLVNTVAQWSTGLSAKTFSYVGQVAFHFEPPNAIYFETNPDILSPMVVVYAMSHAEDLSTVPHSLNHLLLKASLAAFKKSIGSVRSKYQIFETPFGQLSVNIDIKAEGEQEWREVEEELKQIPPPVPVLIG